MVSSIGANGIQTSESIYPNSSTTNIKERLEAFINKDPLKEKTKLGKGYAIFSDEDIRGMAIGRLMTSYEHDIETMEADRVILEIKNKASIEDLKEFLETSSDNLSTPKATENLLKKLDLYDSKGKGFLKLVSEGCARRLAEIVEDEGTLARLSFLSDKDKEGCNNYMSNKSSNDNIKYLQSIILKYYEN